MCRQKLPFTSGVSVYPGEFLQLPSTFCAAGIHSVNFHVAGRSSVNFCQLFMWSGHLPSTFRTIVRTSINFHQLSFRLGELLSSSVNISCGWEIFCQLSVQPGDFSPTYVNFPCDRETFRQLPSNFRAARRSPPTSVNLLCCREIFHQLSVWPVGFLITSGSFPCDSSTFHELPSTFLAAGRPSVQFCQLSVQQRELLSKSVKFLCNQKNFRQHSVWPGDLP